MFGSENVKSDGLLFGGFLVGVGARSSNPGGVNGLNGLDTELTINFFAAESVLPYGRIGLDIRHTPEYSAADVMSMPVNIIVYII